LLKPIPSVTIAYSYSKVGYVCLQGGTLNGHNSGTVQKNLCFVVKPLCKNFKMLGQGKQQFLNLLTGTAVNRGVVVNLHVK